MYKETKTYELKQETWDKDKEPCAVEEFFKANPEATFAMISCSCRRCNPYTC